jgi:DNA-directed RNA polymerase specialized sigma24 family protein
VPSRLPQGWEEIGSRYDDEFGQVSPEVYTAAREIWPRAREHAARVLADNYDSRARTLLLKAAARVTRMNDSVPGRLENIEGYLFRTFTRVVLAELEKDGNRRRYEALAPGDAELRGQAENVERRILLEEVVALMDEWTREVFELLVLDYSYEDIGRHLGAKPKVIRTRFDRNVKRLKALIAGEG